MYKYPVTVEFEDIDAYNIAHHTKILAYCERARVHFLLDNGIDIASSEYGVVITNIQAKFRRPLLIFDQIEIELSVKNLDRIKFSWLYKLMKNGKKAVEVVIEQVFIIKETGKMVSIPRDIKAILESILIIK